jgi:hypothetical protein
MSYLIFNREEKNIFTIKNKKGVLCGYIVFREDFENNKSWVYYGIENNFILYFALKEIVEFMEVLNRK